jgi:hypothetical protein
MKIGVSCSEVHSVIIIIIIIIITLNSSPCPFMQHFSLVYHFVNPLTSNDLYRRRAVSPLKIKIPSKNMREKPTNTPIIHSVY